MNRNVSRVLFLVDEVNRLSKLLDEMREKARIQFNTDTRVISDQNKALSDQVAKVEELNREVSRLKTDLANSEYDKKWWQNLYSDLKAKQEAFASSNGKVMDFVNLYPPNSSTYKVKAYGNEDSKKILFIKAIRETFGISLKEAKDFAQGIPAVIRTANISALDLAAKMNGYRVEIL